MDEIIESGRPLKIPEDAHYSLLRLACPLFSILFGNQFYSIIEKFF